VQALVLDFETRSEEPISNGAYKYVAHPSTDILCLCWGLINISDDVQRIYTYAELESHAHIVASGTWYATEPVPAELTRHLLDPNILVAACNAEFDLGIYECVGVEKYAFPEVAIQRWYCIAAQVRAYGTPGSLNNAVRFIANNPKASAKHPDGRMLIQECSIPPFNDDPALIKRIGAYCMQDVGLAIWVMMKTPRLTPTLQADWHVNRSINENGVPVNVDFAEAAHVYAREELSWVNVGLINLTDGAITSYTQTQRIRKAFITDDIPSGILDICTIFRKGEKKYSLGKDIRRDILDWCQENPGQLDDFRLELLELVDQATATSVSKFQKMVSMAQDGRVHGAFMFAGAGQTLRYSSRGLQLHNLRRDCYDAATANRIETLMLDGQTITNEPDPVIQVLAKMLRPTIQPRDGNVLVVGDWSSIEARVLPWLSDDPAASTLLGQFKRNEAVYKYAAMGIYRLDRVDQVTPAQRQIGKIATLSLGFGGGAGALMGMAKSHGVRLSEDDAGNIVIAWRSRAPWACHFWKKIQCEFINSLTHVDAFKRIGKIGMQQTPVEGYGAEKRMVLTLPCGTHLYYHHLRREKDSEVIRRIKDKGQNPSPQLIDRWRNTVYAKSSYSARLDASYWPVHSLWSGIICENVTQATAASLLREKLRILHIKNQQHPNRFQIIAHCHDEIILECKSSAAENVRGLLQTEMETNPAWATGLPLSAAVKVMERYGK